MAKFENREMQRTYDRTHGGADKSHAVSKGQEKEAMGVDESEHGEHDHEAVVAEHGPAHTVEMKHDHATGQHHVKSVHEDGHVHKAKFGSANEAHDHAAKMAGSSAHENLEDEAANSLEEAGHGDKAKALGVGYEG